MRAAHAVLHVPPPRAIRATRHLAAQERAARVTSRHTSRRGASRYVTSRLHVRQRHVDVSV